MTRRDGLGGDGQFSRETSLGYAVNFVGRAFARALERRLALHGVALGQFPLLLTLWEEDGLTQSEIARRLLIEQPTVANTLKRMERDGLIVASADPQNRRLVRIGLTAKGTIDLRQHRAGLEGTIVPAYFFNQLLGNIPLLGRLFSPETGGGVFAATYAVRGPLKDPAVTVNPLSALTPGVLRKLFGLF